MPESAAFKISDNSPRTNQGLLDERIGLLTGQSVPIIRCACERRFSADRHVLNYQWSHASRSEFLHQL